MGAVRVITSLKYGVKLYAYFLAVAVVGGGGVALGVALVVMTSSGGSDETVTLAGGAVLAFLGTFVFLTGLFGLLHKLVADSVAAGVAAGEPAPAPTEPAGVSADALEGEETPPPATDDRDGGSPGDQSTPERDDPQEPVGSPRTPAQGTAGRMDDTSPDTTDTAAAPTRPDVSGTAESGARDAAIAAGSEPETQSSAGAAIEGETGDATGQPRDVGESVPTDATPTASTDAVDTAEESADRWADETEGEVTANDEPFDEWVDRTAKESEPQDVAAQTTSGTEDPAESPEAGDRTDGSDGQPPEPSPGEIAFGTPEEDQSSRDGGDGRQSNRGTTDIDEGVTIPADEGVDVPDDEGVDASAKGEVDVSTDEGMDTSAEGGADVPTDDTGDDPADETDLFAGLNSNDEESGSESVDTAGSNASGDPLADPTDEE